MTFGLASRKRHDKTVVIAVMGATGAGKSTFIKKVTGRRDVVVGDELISETTQVRAYDFVHGKTKYVLVDTPGFDDTNRPDGEITASILTWLKESYDAGQQLNGVIYLHRIVDPRMTGSAMRNNRMFRKLVGENAFKNVILATTFWETISEAVGKRREAELKDKNDYWGGMIEKGSMMMRLKNNRKSGLEILQHISQSKVVLEAQDEMSRGKSIHDTTAAQEQMMQAEKLRKQLEADKIIEQKRIADEMQRQRREQQLRLQREKAEFERKQREARQREQARREQEAREAEARLEEERRELERELERLAYQRRLREEALERARVEEERRREQEERDMRERFQKSYTCIEYGAQWPCDSCKGNVKKTNVYYHCCFCDNDRYYHCEECGHDCGDATHPYMTKYMITYQTQSSDDGCTVM